MRTFQEIIDEQLAIVQERDEIITADEFSLICEKEFRPPGEKWYSKHRSLVGPGAKVGAAVASGITLGLYGWYRKITDKCSQRCSGMKGRSAGKCQSLCNMNGAKHVLNQIKSRQGKLNDIKDPEKRRMAKDKLRAEYEKWQDRYEKYKDRAQSQTVMMSQMKMDKE